MNDICAGMSVYPMSIYTLSIIAVLCNNSRDRIALI